MQSLLSQEKVTCPSCNLIMDMHVPDQMKKHLQEINIAEEMVKKSKRFSK
ncbi:hypothetical protein FUAX_53260 (plasmid) [Fulvitalea axinellae]|uniref:UBZ4-type domain-containing protein n=1 Tax=Fulvitalea axinellae TaxID=1182444 RepID=A0AAU9D2U3_9BACT|nr:hypothetical protein FUAX_53260 [Fulvitalea axinellae]